MKNRVILSAGSSFETEVERLLWDSVDAALAKRDWALVHCVARRIRSTRFIYRVPPRLLDHEWFFAHLDAPDGFPAWLDPAETELLLEWERLRHPGITDHEKVRAGLRKFAWYVDQIFTVVRPAACLTTNKIDPAIRLFWLAAPHFGAKRLFLERSPFDGIWIEPEGMFGESAIPREFAARDRARDDAYLQAGASAVASLRENPEGFRRQGRSREDTVARLAVLPRPRVFLPFDNLLWTGWAQPLHPQRARDYFFPGLPGDVLREIDAAVRAAGGELYLKRHPCCRALDPREAEGLRFLDDTDLDACLAESDLVIGFNTKVIFPALARKKPCLVLSPNPVAASGACLTCDSLAELPALVRRALADGWNAEWEEKFQRFCGWLDTDFFYRVTERADPARRTQYTLADDLARELERGPLFPAAADAQPALEWLGQLNRGERSRIMTQSSNPVVFFCDVSRLRIKALWNSGISRYVREVVPRLVAQRPGAVVLVANPAKGGQEEKEFSTAELAGRLGAPVLDSREAVAAERDGRSARGEEMIFLSTFFAFRPNGFEELFTRRGIIVYDIFHYSEPQLYGGVPKESNVSRILGSLNPATDYVFLISSFSRREFHRHLDFPYWRTTVAPCAADAMRREDANPGAAAGPRYCLLFAQNDPRKNVEPALRGIRAAFDAAGEEGDLRCVIVVSDVHGAGSLELIERCVGGDERFEKRFSPSDEELADLLRGAEFLVFTPLLEGFGLPALEAISLGCPVITSFTSSLPEVCGNAALYVDPQRPEEIAEAVKLLAANASIRESLRRACPEQAAKFSWPRTARGLAEWTENRVALEPDVAALGSLGQTAPLTTYLGQPGLETVPDRRIRDAVALLGPAAPERLPETATDYARTTELLAEELRKARGQISRLQREKAPVARNLEERLRAFLTPIWRRWRARLAGLFADAR